MHYARQPCRTADTIHSPNPLVKLQVLDPYKATMTITMTRQAVQEALEHNGRIGDGMTDKAFPRSITIDFDSVSITFVKNSKDRIAMIRRKALRKPVGKSDPPVPGFSPLPKMNFSIRGLDDDSSDRVMAAAGLGLDCSSAIYMCLKAMGWSVA